MPSKRVIGVIPCRNKSTRFPGKPIAMINGKPMVWHVWSQAKKAKYIDKLIVATDDNRIYDVCNQYGIESIMTLTDHKTGTDRVAEVAKKVDGNIFVNIQGDEPLIEPESIDRVIVEVNDKDGLSIINAYSLINNMNDLLNVNVVKVITTIDNFALAYSRLAIPYPKGSNSLYKRQLGLYAIKREAILGFPLLTTGYLEKSEGVEMLRFLENGKKIKMVEVSEKDAIPVDIPEDISRIEELLTRRQVNEEKI